MPPVVLDIRHLRTILPAGDTPLVLVDDVSLSVHAGETLAVVGESGSGKTMTFLSVLGLTPPAIRIASGAVMLDGVDLTKLDAEALRVRRGAVISMVFQDPLTALNPLFTIGAQIVRVIRAHRRIGQAEARVLAEQVLRRVHIPDPAKRMDDYPHQLSGGMRQRVLIAMAIALGPKVLIADEPTTALDVTVQAQILELLAELQRETGMGIVLITHDLGLVARYGSRVAVMYGGRVVESGTVDAVFAQPLHPYTAALFRSIPGLDAALEDDLPAIDGQPPMLADLPPGCAFEPRCFLGQGRSDCRTQRPPLDAILRGEQRSACPHGDALAMEGR
jgi:oligopeptide/dipeptide ABC transporter ATP-binding protein